MSLLRTFLQASDELIHTWLFFNSSDVRPHKPPPQSRRHDVYIVLASMRLLLRSKPTKYNKNTRGVFVGRLVLHFIGSAALLVGCSDPTIEPVASEPDIVTLKLTAAADKAAEALDSISGIEQQQAGATPPVENFAKASPSQMQPITLRWSGPIETVVRVLAERAGLKFRVKGNIPTVPISVNIDVYQQPILHVLRDIGLQAGHRADVAVDDITGVVEVRYAAADQSQ